MFEAFQRMPFAIQFMFFIKPEKDEVGMEATFKLQN